MTLLSTIAGLAGAATLAAGSPAAPAAAPVSVVSCEYNTQRGNGALLAPGFATLANGSLAISFVNDAPIAATSVSFEVRYGGNTQTVTDTGTFSRGTPISQTFFATANPNNGAAECTVQSVTLSDGSVWHAG